MKNSFITLSANKNNPKWNNLISRKSPIYERPTDIRNNFERDYTRIIYSNGYKRLKHKTQVFFSPVNDHICTRIEHVTHVESISYTIAKFLGLNTELTRAIAIAHDIGHSPFGHAGEKILSNLSKADLSTSFWHEKNGLERVDYIELLEDPDGYKQNLNLTYAVRDGIISHCGEIDENCLKPRNEFINLLNYEYPNQYSPYSWEGCVVKIADKISYLVRDIEDAIKLGLLDNFENFNNLLHINYDNICLNNTTLINYLIYDLCYNSSPELGLCFSDKSFEIICKIKKFNYENIYRNNKLEPSTRYFNLILSEIYNTLKSCFNNNALTSIEKLKKYYPKLYLDFSKFMHDYYFIPNRQNLKNQPLFNASSKSDFLKAILYYISGMTDNYAIEIYNEIIGF